MIRALIIIVVSLFFTQPLMMDTYLETPAVTLSSSTDDIVLGQQVVINFDYSVRTIARTDYSLLVVFGFAEPSPLRAHWVGTERQLSHTRLGSGLPYALYTTPLFSYDDLTDFIPVDELSDEALFKSRLQFERLEDIRYSPLASGQPLRFWDNTMIAHHQSTRHIPTDTDDHYRLVGSLIFNFSQTTFPTQGYYTDSIPVFLFLTHETKAPVLIDYSTLDLSMTIPGVLENTNPKFSVETHTLQLNVLNNYDQAYLNIHSSSSSRFSSYQLPISNRTPNLLDIPLPQNSKIQDLEFDIKVNPDN